MKKIKTVILDNEDSANKLLKEELSKFVRINLQDIFTDPFKALQFLLKSKDVELLILDKEMPGLDGMDLVQQLPTHICCVIVTGYNEFAVDAFDNNILDYLIKPVSYARLAQMLRKVENKLGLTHSVEQQDMTSRYFTIKHQDAKKLIMYDELFYLKSGKDESELHLIDGSYLVVKERIGVFEDDLPRWEFRRIHNEYIVNRAYFRDFKDDMLLIKCGVIEKFISVGNTYRDMVSDIFNDRLIKRCGYKKS